MLTQKTIHSPRRRITSQICVSGLIQRQEKKHALHLGAGIPEDQKVVWLTPQPILRQTGGLSALVPLDQGQQGGAINRLNGF